MDKSIDDKQILIKSIKFIVSSHFDQQENIVQEINYKKQTV